MEVIKQNEKSPRSGIVTLLTDFGYRDGYVAAMKGVLLGINPTVKIVDISHEIEPQNIIAGAFLLSAHYRYFPAGTVHVAVIDPGVGTERRALACFFDRHYFVAPDNGLLDFCLRDYSYQAVRLSNQRYWRQPISETFHGRDIFAPVAAHLAKGLELSELGDSVKLMNRQKPRQCRVENNRLLGEIVFIDRFGNLISNIDKKELFEFSGKYPFRVRLPNVTIHGIKPSYGHVEKGAVVALIDSFDCLEVGINQGNAHLVLNISIGDRIIVERGV